MLLVFGMLKKLRRWLARLGPLLIYQLARTWRIRGDSVALPPSAVIVFWHGDMLPVWKFFSGAGSVALISQSRDGGLLADLLGRLDFQVVRGSSSKGGKEALASLVDAAHAGRRVLITPDGPRGPRHEMKPGAVVVAHRAGVPLVLCRVRAAAAMHGSHWDRFLLPLPFARIELDFVILDIPPGAEREALDRLRTYAQNLLKNLTPLL